MPNTPLPFNAADFPVALWGLLGLILVFQLVGLVQRVLLGAQLRRLEKSLERRRKEPSASVEERAPSGSEDDSGGLFEAYLDENPERRMLSKKEQFDGFRKWRNEKGLNWSK
ncbi:hypothetical protein HNR46_004060 [Haloferula luteola]|uniref:Uncharacterized protein n=1 Tax=Haloferula luteola TaxID=595692 RepID=A0A840V6A8_9BACT|nr:hypothetical protein [Haloferula luteola]MBB5353797.1 hypothetical protein [Haloferula luteola]